MRLIGSAVNEFSLLASRWKFPVYGHHVSSTPPSGIARPHRRPPTRHKRRAQELPPRLQILGSAYLKAPLRQCHVLPRERPPIMEKHVSGSLHLPRVLHQKSDDPLSQGGYIRRLGRRRTWLDSGFFLRRALRPESPRCARDISSPIPRILTRAQIPPYMV